MVGHSNLIQLICGVVILLWTGKVGCDPVMMYYNSGQEQTPVPKNNGLSTTLVMPAEQYDQSPAAEDRKDTLSSSEQDQPETQMSTSTTFTFPQPLPFLMPIFQQVQPYKATNISSNNDNSTTQETETEQDSESLVKRLTRMVPFSNQNFHFQVYNGGGQMMKESSLETFWNFPKMDGMFRFSPPFLVPAYASVPPPTQGPATTTNIMMTPNQPQHLNSHSQQPQQINQPISYQIPILNNQPTNNQNNFQSSQPHNNMAPLIMHYFPQPADHSGHTNYPQNNQVHQNNPQTQWQVSQLSPELEAAIFQKYPYKQQPQQPQYQQYNMNSMPPPNSQPYFIQAPHPPQPQPMNAFPMNQMMPQQMSPQQPLPPAQLENYEQSQTSTKVPLLPQFPPNRSLMQYKPEIISSTTPMPGLTTPTPTNANYGISSYASAYGNYAKEEEDVIGIQRFDHVIGKDGYSVEFKTENGIDSNEEGHLKVVKKQEQDGEMNNKVDVNVYSPASESKMGVVHVKSGKVSWTSPECITFTLRYEADEYGYRPSIEESSNLECLKYGKNFNNFLDQGYERVGPK